MLNTKSQAGIIVVILIILVSLVAIVILWNVFNPLIADKAEEVEIESVITGLKIEEALLYETGSSVVRVRRASGNSELSALKFVFYDDDDMTYVEDKKTDLPALYETLTYYFGPPVGIGKIVRVSVLPVIGGKIGREFESDSLEITEVPLGLISWWRFGDNQDFVGENHGTLVDAGIEQGYLKLNGDGYFSVLNDESLNLVDDKDFAVSLWINKEQEGSLIKKGDASKNYEVSLNSDNGIDFSFTEGGVLNEERSDDDVIGSNWNHVVVSADWDGIYTMYVNEVLVGSGGLNVDVDSTTSNLEIGNDFKGKIDEVMIFEKSLSQNQASSLYISQKDSF